MKQLHIPAVELQSRNFSTTFYKALAKVSRPVKAEAKGEDTTIFPNYVTRNFGEDILAVLDIAKLHSFELGKDATKAEKEELAAAKAEAEINLFKNGIAIGEQVYEFLTATPSQKKQGKATFVKLGKRAEIMEGIGLTDDVLDGTAYIKCEDKILPNMLSGQHEGSIANANLGMKNIFVLKNREDDTFYRHNFEAKKVQHLNVAGLLQGKVEAATLSNKVGDANGVVIREFLPEYKAAFAKYCENEEAIRLASEGKWIEAYEEAYKSGDLKKVNAKVHEDAVNGKTDLYWVEQCRGKGLKATLSDAPVVTWCFDLGITALDGKFAVATLKELHDANKAVLVTEDCLKASALWNTAEKWEKWCEKGYEKILCCDNGHVSAVRRESKNRVNTSRQHLCPVVYASTEAVEGFTAETHDRLLEIANVGDETTKKLCKLFGEDERNSDVCKAFATSELVPAMNEAESGKVSVPGTWAMCVWDLKPIIAVAAHLDNEDDRQALVAKARTMKGDTVALNNKAEEKVAALGRYPSLNKNLMLVRITRNSDICDNALVMSWDLAANDVMKADTDGDHLVAYFAESEEERREALGAIYEKEHC